MWEEIEPKQSVYMAVCDPPYFRGIDWVYIFRGYTSLNDQTMSTSPSLCIKDLAESIRDAAASTI